MGRHALALGKSGHCPIEVCCWASSGTSLEASRGASLDASRGASLGASFGVKMGDRASESPCTIRTTSRGSVAAFRGSLDS